MRGLRSTLVLLALAIGLGAYVYFVERHRPPASEAEPDEKLFTFEADDVATLEVRSEEGTVTALERTGDAWRIVAPIDAPADDANASSIASALAALEVRRVVEEGEEGPVDLEPFGLDEPLLDVGFSLADSDAPQRLLLGDQTPTGADRYAKLDDSDRVLLVAGYLDTTFDKTTFDLRDKTILEFDRDDLDGLEITGGDRAIRFVKDGDDWRLAEPWTAGADFGVVEGLIGSLGSGRMRSVESEDTGDLEPFGLGDPAFSVAVSAGSSTATLHVGGETPDGDYFARDAARPIVFTVDASLVTSLERDASEYRRKAMFAFRSYNATRLEVERGAGAAVFEKTAAAADEATDESDEADAETEDVWRRVEPDPADVPRTEMDDLLTKVSNLRAESFVESRPDTGLGPEQVAATIRARFGDDDVEERVTVWRAGDDTFAVRGDEAGAARIDGQAFDDALEALDAAVAAEAVQDEDEDED